MNLNKKGQETIPALFYFALFGFGIFVLAP